MSLLNHSLIMLLFISTSALAQTAPQKQAEIDLPETGRYYSFTELKRAALETVEGHRALSQDRNILLVQDYFITNEMDWNHPLARHHEWTIHEGMSTLPALTVYQTGTFSPKGDLVTQLDQKFEMVELDAAAVGRIQERLKKEEIPNLYAHFEACTDRLLSPEAALEEARPVAEYLKKHPSVTIELKGHTGLEGSGNPPVGENEEVWSYTTACVGFNKFTNIGNLMLERAEAEKQLLVQLGIDPNRIKTARGSQQLGPQNRRVSIKYNH